VGWAGRSPRGATRHKKDGEEWGLMVAAKPGTERAACTEKTRLGTYTLTSLSNQHCQSSILPSIQDIPHDAAVVLVTNVYW
jgi:hypothetical protein